MFITLFLQIFCVYQIFHKNTLGDKENKHEKIKKNNKSHNKVNMVNTTELYS